MDACEKGWMDLLVGIYGSRDICDLSNLYFSSVTSTVFFFPDYIASKNSDNGCHGFKHPAYTSFTDSLGLLPCFLRSDCTLFSSVVTPSVTILPIA